MKLSRISIVGGGIGGLSAALASERKGILAPGAVGMSIKDADQSPRNGAT